MTRGVLVCIALSVALLASLPVSGAFAADAPAVETIVIVRHGEKPPRGLGQLDCQGLNRALALPAVTTRQFGKPAAIFAPNPAQEKIDQGVAYDYVRPLATIEPAAIAFGLPVDASIGLTDIAALKTRLEDSAFHSAFVLVGWEHAQIVQLTRLIMTDYGGDPAIVPQWKGNDFDGMYVLRINRSGGSATIAFEWREEGLNGRATTCPRS